MKKFSEIAHLYLGCKVIALRNAEDTGYDLEFQKNEIGELSLVQTEKSDVIIGADESDNYRYAVSLNDGYACAHDFNDFKPVLKRISDMSEEDLKEAFQICYRSVYNHDAEIPHNAYILRNEIDSIGIVFYEKHSVKNWWRYLSIEPENILFYCDGASLTIPILSVFAFLLSKGYDLFGLIDAGEAIDEKTLQQTHID